MFVVFKVSQTAIHNWAPDLLVTASIYHALFTSSHEQMRKSQKLRLWVSTMYLFEASN